MSRLAIQKRYPPRACAVSRARQRGAALLPRPPFLRHATTDEAAAAQAFSMATPELTSDLVHGPAARQEAGRNARPEAEVFGDLESTPRSLRVSGEFRRVKRRGRNDRRQVVPAAKLPLIFTPDQPPDPL